MSLKHVILTILNREPRTGYDITRQFDDVVGHFWHASHQQVYRELAQMRAAGWVRCRELAQSGKPDKKIYEITSQGQEELLDWLESPLPQPRIKDEFLVRLLSPDLLPAEKSIAQLDQMIAAFREALTTYDKIEQQLYPPSAHSALTPWERRMFLVLRKGTLMMQARLSWALEARAALTEEGG